MYHRIADRAEDPFDLCVAPVQFERQLELLKSEYLVVPLVELLPRLRAGRTSRPMVALTFDDGYADNLFAAGSMLKKHDLPATVFITTGYLDGRREFWWDDLLRLVQESKTDPARWKFVIAGSKHSWAAGTSRGRVYRELHELLRMQGARRQEQILAAAESQAGIARVVRPENRPLTAEECRRLARTGRVEIGAHTIHHLWLAAHPPAEQGRELAGARRDLEDILGSPVRSLAYPYGKRDSAGTETLRLASAAGFELACANVRGQVWAETDPLWLPRFAPGNAADEEFRIRMQSFFAYWNPPHRPRGMMEVGMLDMKHPAGRPAEATTPAEQNPSLLRFLAGKVLRRVGIGRKTPKKRKKVARRIPILTTIFARIRFGFQVAPLSVLSAADRGKPIHRYYLERFFEEFAQDIRGHCLEFLNNQYTGCYGKDRVQRLDILHKEGSGTSTQATIIADLLAPHSIPADTFDCIICTQTLHIVEDPQRFLAELYALLKPGGVLLLGVPHIANIQPWWHELWRFTPEGMQFLATKIFGAENIIIRSYGNSLAAAGELRGLCAEEFTRRELDPQDDRFAMEVCLRGVKRDATPRRRTAQGGR